MVRNSFSSPIATRPIVNAKHGVDFQGNFMQPLAANHRVTSPSTYDSKAAIVNSTNRQMAMKRNSNDLLRFDPLAAGQTKGSTDKKRLSLTMPATGVAPIVTGTATSPPRQATSPLLRQQRSNEENILPEGRPGSREVSPRRPGENDRSPPTPSTSPKELMSPRSDQTPKRRELFRLSIGSPTNGHKTSRRQSPTEEGISSPRARKMPWSKLKHRRTKSLEPKEVPTTNSPPTNLRSSVHGQPARDSSFVEDCLDLRFDNLQIPSLAKPSPTSFLTGHENEVMRTGEHEAAPFQLELPSLAEVSVVARLNEFVENYRQIDQNFDLSEWKNKSRFQLEAVDRPEHIPIAQLLLECGEDVSIRGVVECGQGGHDRSEMVVFEGQRHIIAVLRGTTEQQTKPNNGKLKKKGVAIGPDREGNHVYQCFWEEYQRMETQCFALMDKLTEEQPFCDVVFTGYSFGAGLATLAATRYANARPTTRVQCYPMGSPKVGFDDFRLMVNSTPNLRLVRVEYGQDARCQLLGPGGTHVGHTLVIHGSLGNTTSKPKLPAVLAYRFDTPKPKKFKTIHPDLRSYVAALDKVASLKLAWVSDFVGTSGKGVVVNNESRQMV